MPIVVPNAVTDVRSINHAFGHTNDASIHITDKSTVVHTFFNSDFCTHRVASTPLANNPETDLGVKICP